jgi:hypothetical protein
MLVRPPEAAGNSPSRHNTVYRCRIEGREEAGLNVKTSLREKMMNDERVDEQAKKLKSEENEHSDKRRKMENDRLKRTERK